MTKRNDPNEIRLERIYDAPVKAVWDAWIEPEQVAQWWGPRGFTITTQSKDVRPGGTWRYTMHGPDGTDYPNKTLYHEVEKHSKLVYDHGATDSTPPLFRVSVLFKEHNGQTHLDMSMRFVTAEAAIESRKFIKKAGGESTWDRLGEYLGKELNDREVFIINRSFPVPLERMFSLWTDPQHFSRWLPPTGFTMEFKRVDIRTGGSSLYCMSNGGGVTMWGRASYLEVRRPDRLVYTQQFCDENEQLSRHPMAPVWPATMLTTVTLSAEGPEQTRVSIHVQPYGDCTPAEVAAFAAARAGMTLGWGGSFEKLEGLLA
jgi:uncharacterized protein YndB with AHSA1/START domain